MGDASAGTTQTSAGKIKVEPTAAELGIVVEIIDAVTAKPLPSVTNVPGTRGDVWVEVVEGQEVFVAVANGTNHGVVVQTTIDGQPTPCDTVAPPSTRAIIGFFDPKLVKHKAIKMHAVDSRRPADSSVDASDGAGTICVNLYKDETPKRERFSDAETVRKHWRADKDQCTPPACTDADGHAKETTCLRATEGSGVSQRPQTFTPQPFVRGKWIGLCAFRYTDEFGFAIRKVPLPKKEDRPDQARPKKRAKLSKAKADHAVIDITNA